MSERASAHASMRWAEPTGEVAEAQQQCMMDGVDTVGSISRRSESAGRCARSVEHLFLPDCAIVALFHFTKHHMDSF